MRRLLVALALVLSACSAGQDGPTTITFWDNNGGPGRTPIYQELIKRFEAANPDIKVEYVGIPSSSVQQKYDTAIAGGSTPDVGGVTTSYLAHLVGQDALEPADDRVEGGPLKGKLLSGLLETVRQTAPDGKLYAVPASGNLDVIWYRSDRFAEAKISEPSTWDDLVKAATQLTKPAENQYGFTIRGGAGSVFQLLSEAYSYSGIEKFYDGGKSTVSDPRNAELVRKVAELYKKATPEADVNNNYTQMVAQFTGGTVAMMHHNLGSTADVMKALGPERVSAMPLPKGPSGKRTVVPNPTDGFAVFKGSKNRDASWKFVEFLTSAESSGYWNEKVGQIPANTDVRGAEWIQKNPAVKMALGVLEDPATVIVPAPVYLPEYSSITKTDTEPLYQKVLLGQMSAQEFLDQLAAKLTTAQQEWEKRK
ncbi:carbohydrate ABC transporter substrate-binding protein (CUT1 family) [Lentzea atacamensis]|uniref:Carbohydrate ABC transporter substrate-binding protein (CUT1 family) n=1 Tax=Lentzea atacamensis TaxID=531938 RepID=A0A316HUM5_9PSEU|nr:sugar ABC transporter substrate-binding protein [Lentzea atacamensis]PWK83778.1 carbohydrate ABC transporter substrate-binding protein (CUT1 family) [Lentzea atacamensis]